MDATEKIKRLEALLEKDPSDHLAHFLLGREYLEAARFDDAARVLQQCVEMNPQFTAAYRFLGDAHRKAGRNKEAVITYELGIGVAQETGDLQAGQEMQVFLKKLESDP